MKWRTNAVKKSLKSMLERLRILPEYSIEISVLDKLIVVGWVQFYHYTLTGYRGQLWRITCYMGRLKNNNKPLHMHIVYMKKSWKLEGYVASPSSYFFVSSRGLNHECEAPPNFLHTWGVWIQPDTPVVMNEYGRKSVKKTWSCPYSWSRIYLNCSHSAATEWTEPSQQYPGAAHYM